MHIPVFADFAPRQIVPVDSTINEAYVLRCIYRAVTTKDASFLTSALQSLSMAMTHHRHPDTETNADTLLDTLIPIIHTKCNPPKLQSALRYVKTNLDGDEVGASGFSMCIFQSATMVKWPSSFRL